MTDNICSGCHKQCKLSTQNKNWICVNGGCDFGRNHSSDEWKNLNLKFDGMDALFQFVFWGSIASMITASFMDTFQLQLGLGLLGFFGIFISNLFGFLFTDNYRGADWDTRKKMYWWIAIPLRKWQ